MNESTTTPTDAQLVAASLRGSREAFGELVERHQQFICALAYAKTGSIAASEDIAQEAFIAAWKNLAALRVRENFRGWLCGTTRNLAARFHRSRRGLEPLSDEIAAAPAAEMMTREEEALLWSSLEKLPETVREPLVLFYRGGRSVREAAEALGLSEDAVKQRLSRGRAMLREAVRGKVESALVRSRPGAAFTIAVLAAIPATVSTAHAAGVGLAMAKGATAISWPLLAGPLFGGLAGAFGGWFGMKCSLDRAESARERRFIRRVAAVSIGSALGMTLGLLALIFWGRRLLAANPALWIALMAGLVIGYVGVCFATGAFSARRQLRIRAEERVHRGLPEKESDPLFFEYRSRWKLLGLPLVHVRLGSSMGHIACGWIAYGNIAIAPLLAFGGIAVGGISVGGISVGLITTAGIGLGLLFSFSGLAAGGVAIGGLAIGWLALGGAALGGLAAMGGAGWAGFYALGHNVSAPHANDAAAKAFFRDHGITQLAGLFGDYGWLLQFAIFLPVVVISVWVRKCRSARQAAAVSSE